MASFVDITGISDDFLAFIGYELVYETPKSKLYNNKGEEFIVSKRNIRLLKVDDENDVAALRSRKRIALPPKKTV